MTQVVRGAGRPSCCEFDALLRAAWALALCESPPMAEFLRGANEDDQFERAIAFRVGHHLATLIQAARSAWASPFVQATVDMELHRKTHGTLKLPAGPGAEPRRIFPDLIVHVRGRQDANLLVVEFKASSNHNLEQRTKDREVVYDLVMDLGYSYGVCADFDVAQRTMKLGAWLGGVSDCSLHPAFRGDRAMYLKDGT